jgi:branched-chain amino acid transport system substrate-binding protein
VLGASPNRNRSRTNGTAIGKAAVAAAVRTASVLLAFKGRLRIDELSCRRAHFADFIFVRTMSTETNSDFIKIGSLFSRTGVTAFVERTLSNAVSLAVSEVNSAGGIGGRHLVLEEADPKGDLKLFEAETLRLLESGVSNFFGCYLSSTRKVTLPIIAQHQKLLFYPTFYEGFEFSPNCIYSGAVPNQNTFWLADYLLDSYEKKYLLVGSNYVFPYETNRVMRDLVANRGGDVVDEIYIPLNPSPEEIARVIEKIKAALPIVVFSTLVGQGAVSFYKAYHEAGIDPKTSPIASLITGEAEVEQIGARASAGHVTAAPYFSSIDTPQNLKFVAHYRDRYGKQSPICAAAEAAYLQVHLFAEAAKRAGAVDRESILRVLPTFSFEAPQGVVRVSRENHHTHLWPKVAIVDANGEFRIVRESFEPVPPDPYLKGFDPGNSQNDEKSF